MRIAKLLTVVLVLLTVVHPSLSQIQLSEFVAMNQRGLVDNDGDPEDWIEIENKGEDGVNLGGYTLSTDFNELDMWVFPNTWIAPGGREVIFASGKNRIESELHTNFKLEASNSRIILCDDFDQVLDEISTTHMIVDVSRGRRPSNQSEWVFFLDPTPGDENTTLAHEGIMDAPLFSVSGGLFNSPVNLELGLPGDGELRYSLGGFEPQVNSTLYEGPLSLDTTTIVRARAFAPGMIPSEIVTHSYFFDEFPDMALISLVTEPGNLWDEETGIYVLGNCYNPEPPFVGANFWQDWSRPAHIEFFETGGVSAFAQDMGIKIYGGWNRCRPQKTIRLMAKSQFGPKSIDYRIFPDKDVTKFKNLLLRNSGNDWTVTHFRDALMQNQIADTNLDRQAYRPAAVFFNGEYMGIHNVRERIDEHFLAENHGLENDEIDLLEEQSSVIEGDNEDYLTLLAFIETHDLTDESHYQYVGSMMDLENFAAYNVMEIFFGNSDWPAYNRKYWQSSRPDGRWRWIPFDLDFGLGRYTPPSHNTLAWALDEDSEASANRPWSTLMLRKLLENDEFRQDFIALYADWLNSRFLPSNLLAAVDEHRNLIVNEMPRHLARWDRTLFAWEGSIDNVREYILERPDFAREHIMDEFELPDTLQLALDIQPAGAGRIEMTGYTVDSPWTGIYFQGNPVKLKAIPSPGFRFKRWSGLEQASDEELVLDLNGSSVLVAYFEDENVDNRKVVFNEINYHSAESFDPGDWVELVNCSDKTQDLSGWTFKDGNDDHAFTLPRGTLLNPREFLVLCQDLEKFQSHFRNIGTVVGDFQFGLDGSGEMLRLYNWAGESEDWVRYGDRSPWSSQPDGNGPTLELISTELDNNLPESWTSSKGHGTPGEDNNIIVLDTVERFTTLSAPYPSPFNPTCTIQFSLKESSAVCLIAYDIQGREVDRLLDCYLSKGEHRVTWRPEELASGIYLIRLIAGEVSQEKTAILLK